MAKTKTQKRKAKLKKRATNKSIYNSTQSESRIDFDKIRKAFPDKQERLHYIRSLIAEFSEVA